MTDAPVSPQIPWQMGELLLKSLSSSDISDFVPQKHVINLLQVLTLKSSVGKIASCTIPVKNAGNITAKVKLKIEGDAKQFSVKPIQLRLKPDEVRRYKTWCKLHKFLKQTHVYRMHKCAGKLNY